MKIAITGGTGFVGRHLASALLSGGHKVVLIARGVDSRDMDVRHLENTTFAHIGISSMTDLLAAFAGCDAVAHCAGINRATGGQTYEDVHIGGTLNVMDAAMMARVKKVVLLSFLRARPDCNSPYHESKWMAEEIVRGHGVDYTVIKAGMIYGKGDHMLDHLSHTLHSLPLFASVGMKEKPIRPVAVEDVVRIMVASLTDKRLSRQTMAVTGPQQMLLSDAVRQVARITGRHVLIFPCPVFVHRRLAWLFERTMTIPLISSAQVFMLSEGMTEPLPPCSPPPDDLAPQTRFEDAWIRERLPEAKPFGLDDFRCCPRPARR
jgi:nucleoside-diphosphate-sugar epimerase